MRNVLLSRGLTSPFRLTGGCNSLLLFFIREPLAGSGNGVLIVICPTQQFQLFYKLLRGSALTTSNSNYLTNYLTLFLCRVTLLRYNFMLYNLFKVLFFRCIH